LVYALKIKEEWHKDSLPKDGGFYGGNYFDIEPKSDWNFGLLKKIVDDPSNELKVIHKPFNQNDFVWNEIYQL